MYMYMYMCMCMHVCTCDDVVRWPSYVWHVLLAGIAEMPTVLWDSPHTEIYSVTYT